MPTKKPYGSLGAGANQPPVKIIPNPPASSVREALSNAKSQVHQAK